MVQLGLTMRRGYGARFWRRTPRTCSTSSRQYLRAMLLPQIFYEHPLGPWTSSWRDNREDHAPLSASLHALP